MFNSVLFFSFVLAVNAIKKWYQIPNHDEEIFVNYEDMVPNFNKAKKLCKMKNAINLILYKKPVIEFLVTRVLKDLSKLNLSKFGYSVFLR